MPSIAEGVVLIASSCQKGAYLCIALCRYPSSLSYMDISSVTFLFLILFFVNNLEKTYEMLPMLLDQRWPPLFSISYQRIIFNDSTSYIQSLGGQGQRRMPRKSTFFLLKVAYCRGGDGYSFFWFRRGVFIRGFCQQVLSV